MFWDAKETTSLTRWKKVVEPFHSTRRNQTHTGMLITFSPFCLINILQFKKKCKSFLISKSLNTLKYRENIFANWSFDDFLPPVIILFIENNQKNIFSSIEYGRIFFLWILNLSQKKRIKRCNVFVSI